MTLIQWVTESLALSEKQIFNDLHSACPLQDFLWEKNNICGRFNDGTYRKIYREMNFSPYPKFQSRESLNSLFYI